MRSVDLRICAWSLDAPTFGPWGNVLHHQRLQGTHVIVVKVEVIDG